MQVHAYVLTDSSQIFSPSSAPFGLRATCEYQGLNCSPVCPNPGYSYAFAELATGGDMFSLLDREEDLEELEVRWIVKQILHGIAYLHSKGVAHRDIKLENILCMVGPRVGNRIVLSDFGCCAVASRGRMTSNVGTEVYQAP